MLEVPKEQAAKNAVLAADSDVRAMAGSNFSAKAVELFSALEAVYMHDMTRCKTEQVPELQAMVKQVRRFKCVFAGDETIDSRIVF